MTLYPIQLTVPASVPAGASITLSSTGRVRIWESANRSGDALITPNTTSYTWYSSVPTTLYVEGAIASAITRRCRARPRGPEPSHHAPEPI